MNNSSAPRRRQAKTVTKTSFVGNEPQSMLTGNQLRAARALLGMHQSDLARRAALNVNTIRHMESSGAESITGRFSNIHAVQSALEAAGIEFIAEDDGGVGVRLHRGKDDR